MKSPKIHPYSPALFLRIFPFIYLLTALNAQSSDLPLQSGLILHLDASQITGHSDGSPVSTWQNLAPSGNDATASSDVRPTYIANAIEGRPALRFDGVNDWMSVGNLRSSSGPVEIFIVAQSADTSGGNWQRLISAYTTGSNDWSAPNWNILRPHTSGSPQGFEWTIFSSVKSGCHVNGLKLGRNGQWNTGYLGGEIAEVIIFGQSLTQADRDLIDDHLTVKYGSAVIAEDSFSGYAPGPLPGQGEGTGWSGPWTGDSSFAFSSSGALSQPGVAGDAGGGAVTTTAGNFGSGTRHYAATRTLATPITAASTYYFSFISKITDNPHHAILRLNDDTGGDAIYAGSWSHMHNSDWRLVLLDGGSFLNTSTGISKGSSATHFVLKVTLVDGSGDSAELFVNPANAAALSGAPDATRTFAGDFNGINSITALLTNKSGYAGELAFDNFLIGTDPSDIFESVSRPNILFISVDDLVPVLGCYGDQTMLANNGTPNIDSLAQQGFLFENHHVALPICGASRASLTSGLMPAEHGVTIFTALRHPNYLPNLVTLPQHFKNHNYETAAKGKFHDHRTVGDTTQPLSGNGQYPNGTTVDDPQSWSIPFAGVFDGSSGVNKPGNPAVFVGPNSGTYIDEHTATVSMQLLDTLEAGNKPFFLAVGFVRPHLPFEAPQTYWDIFDGNNNGLYNDDLDYPAFTTSPANTNGSFSTTTELTSYEPYSQTGQIPTGSQILELRHGYYASVAMVDDLTGQIIDYLATKDDPVQPGKTMDETTIIVFWGDHGFSLGHHNRWGKHIDDEVSSWAPLIIYDPRNPGNGARTMTPVSTLDIFPTLCELAGLPLPTQPMNSSTPTGRPLRGRSLTPLLDNNSDHVNGGALIHKWLGGTSYIYRTEQYRLIEKYSGNSVSGRELYDLGSNRVEMVNVAGFPEYQIILHELTTSMRREPAAQGVNLVQNASALGAPSNRALPGLQVSTTPSTAFLDWPSSSGSGSAYDVQYRSNQSQSFAPLAGFQSVIGGAADVPISGSSNYFQVELANNVAPYFVVDPLIRSSAQVGQSYSGSLSGAAIDGGSVTYAKEAGPNWLSVAANGNLSGTPQSDDVGANYFTISATDAQGAAAQAKLFINVLAP